MLTITRNYEFEAAHFLPNHLGKCRHLHGHSYKLNITLSGDLYDIEGHPRYGMILDFAELDDIVKPILEHSDLDEKGLDHGLLNNVFDYPTAECMVIGIAKMLEENLNKFKEEKNIGDRNIFVERVDLWETSRSYASWVRDK